MRVSRATNGGIPSRAAWGPRSQKQATSSDVAWRTGIRHSNVLLCLSVGADQTRRRTATTLTPIVPLATAGTGSRPSSAQGSRPGSRGSGSGLPVTPGIGIQPIRSLTVPATAAAPAAAGEQPQQYRLHWVDWLRVFLTLVVLVHNCVNAYGNRDQYWFGNVTANPDVDRSITMLVNFFCGANQAYFMGLFFLLAGYFTPGSCDRKGLAKHVLDRTLRLMLPVVVSFLVIQPVTFYIARVGARPNGWPYGLAESPNVYQWYFNNWLPDQQPSIAQGLMWFVYTLWWFDLAYVLVRVLWANWGKHYSSCCLPKHEDPPAEILGQEFTVNFMMKLWATLLAAFTVLSFGSRMASYYTLPIYGWIIKWYVIIFMPSFLAQYVIAYALGVLAYHTNALHRIPAYIGFRSIATAAIWWLARFVIHFAGGRTLTALWGTAPISGSAVAYVFWYTFSEQAFAVMWSTGLIVVFRELFNEPPGRMGALVISTAYAAYILQPLTIALYGWALYRAVFYSRVVSAAALALLVVPSTWMLGAVIKGIPHIPIDRVL